MFESTVVIKLGHGRPVLTERSDLITLIPPATNDDVIIVTFFFHSSSPYIQSLVSIAPPSDGVYHPAASPVFPRGPSPSALIVTHVPNDLLPFSTLKNCHLDKLGSSLYLKVTGLNPHHLNSNSYTELFFLVTSPEPTRGIAASLSAWDPWYLKYPENWWVCKSGIKNSN